MKKGIINEEIKRIHEIMGISPKNLITEGDILRLLGIGAEEAFEKISKSEGEALAKEFEELTAKVSLEPAEAILVSSVLRKLFPSSVEKYITNLRNQFTQPGVIETYEQLFKNPKATNELISNTIKKAGVDMTPEGVQIWRDVAKDAPIEIKPTKSSAHGAPVAKTNDIIINTGTINRAATESVDKQAIHYVGAQANSKIDNILGDLDSYNLNTTPAQYEQMLLDFKQKIAAEKLRVQRGLNDLRLQGGKMDLDIKYQDALRDQQRFIQEMEKNEVSLSQQKDQFFENQESLRQERELRAKRGEIDIKKGEQGVKNLEQQGKTLKVDEIAKRTKIYKTIVFSLVGLGLIGVGLYSFFNKSAAAKLGDTIHEGGENTGTVLKHIWSGSDSTQNNGGNKLDINPVKDSVPAPKPNNNDDPLNIRGGN